MNAAVSNLKVFEENLTAAIDPALSAKGMAERIVTAALEAEFGKAFTLSPGFAKIVGTLAEVVVTNPELRRQALAVASVYIKKNRDRQKS
ncbi:hypothetical protein HZB08_01845 [Candidatus Saganbacteria bacterium]|uniref:Uncharacterized protein n=1 Tax=Candidatus Saganbacteria bacterium TaxID=2575572 RepID=A0A9D6UP33_UNCSA|nr:hypothetical protein [Candidatus Saganbacteria bacterium]